MRVYLIRHGETAPGARFRFQSPDTPLSPHGRKQVRDLVVRLAEVRTDALYTSPYRRAHETADILAEAWGVRMVHVQDVFAEKYNSSDVLRKSYWSLAFVRLAMATIVNLFSAQYRWSDEETLDELVERAVRARRFLEAHTHESVVVVSHALLVAALVDILQEDAQPTIQSVFGRIGRFVYIIVHALCMRNGAIYTFEYDPVQKQWRRV